MKKRRLYGALILAVMILFISYPLSVQAEGFSYPLDTDGKLVIVIDPGHSGKNLGADYNGFLEKEMNMTVANAMMEELQKYNNVTVYLTHTDADTDMSILERAEFAASVSADFLFCLHFNMSPENKLFGSEVWVSAFGEENREGYRFGRIQMDEMKNMGLFLRGIKTRFGENGKDYYGILRYCEERSIPAALIEHCHVDHDADVGFCDSEEDLLAFGRADATAVAKYFGLKSDILGVDYSDYEKEELVPGALYVQEDTSDPDFCTIEKAYVDLENGKLGVTVTATDYDTPLLYYAYSIDGGETFTPYIAWPDTDLLEGVSPDTITIDIPVPVGISPFVIVRAVNQYDRYTDSNLLAGLPVFTKVSDEPAADWQDADEANNNSTETATDAEATEVSTGFKAPQRPQVEEKDRDFYEFLKLCLLAAGVLFVSLLLTNVILVRRKRQRRKKNRRK